VDTSIGGDDLRRRFLDEFVAEATEHLDAAETVLVAFDTSGFDAAGQALVMRAMHTIKGSAGYLALAAIQELAHAIETAVKRLDRAGQADSERLEVLFEALDTLRELLARPTEVGDVPATLLEALQAPREEAQISHPAASHTIESALENVVRQQCQALGAAAEHFARDSGDSSAMQILRRVIATIRSAATYAEDHNLLTMVGELDQSTDADPARCETLRLQLEAFLAKSPTESTTVPEATVAARAPSRSPDQASPPTFQGQFLRVESSRVDALVNQTGELLTLRNQLQHFLQSLESEGCATHLCRAGKSLAFGLGKAVDELQSVALELRLIQLSVMFQRLPRVARDVGLRTRKRIQLRIEGGETEIDKGVAEVIADPLVHMLRNSIDHGVEVPVEREAAGKDPEGQVTVRASREGNDIVISVRDDGRGVDPDVVRAKAVASGLLSEAAAADLTLDGIYDLCAQMCGGWAAMSP
jgi:two-component system chemotaxis sensor kinase CheA